MRSGHVLYRIFNGAGALLYVGATTNPARRFEQHAQHQPWWDEAVNITLDRRSSAEDLAAAELKAIETESPRYNQISSGTTPVWTLKPRGPIGDGSVFQRADGMWCGSLELPRKDGKRKQIRVYGSTREEAAAKLAKRKLRIQS